MTLDLSAIKDNLNDASDGQLIKYVMSLIKEVERMQAKLDVTMEFLKKQAEYECYVMCGCQDDARRVLGKIKKL